MNTSYSPSPWKANNNSGVWEIIGEDNKKISTITQSDNSERYAKRIAMSPYVLEALEAMVKLIGDEDLPDNGDLSGAAVCDMARAALEFVR